ncbi:MAG TPA: sensor histidine kinase [Alphaproteobacteria bacterium]|jgi:two-component system sensor histidine kinase ChvG|nr:sensor histidine kinase [Alphaproteobacteria bacterium]
MVWAIVTAKRKASSEADSAPPLGDEAALPRDGAVASQPRPGSPSAGATEAPPFAADAAPDHVADTEETPISPAAAKRGPFSSLTRRILAVNVLALAILVAGLLYLGQYEKGLIRAHMEALQTQGEIFAEALGEGAVAELPYTPPFLLPDLARLMMRRLVAPLHARARLFDLSGNLIVDSWFIGGPGTAVRVERLPEPGLTGRIATWISDSYDWIADQLHRRRLEPYHENAHQTAADYGEVVFALNGEIGHAIRGTGKEGMILSVAVPVQRYKQVVGAIMLSTDSSDIEAALRSVRIDILRVFLFALGITVLLSVYLAGTIARPVRRLAVAADRVTHGHGRQAVIPDFTSRKDEIGDLSASLREMTAALWHRMDAIEGFAADVAHEIKNPLTSLRSAVETVSRITDPNSQRQLMAIILEDVQRLDRLISDISDASRLDAELSRAELETADIGGILTMLTDLHRSTAEPNAPRIDLDVLKDADLRVAGIESRLVQVFRNLFSNAVSFSPPGGRILCRARSRDGYVIVTVEDEGPGIPEGKREAIFERFYTERPAEEKFGTHSGLGLSISRQIVEAHRGRITADNRRDPTGKVCGARFTVVLPAS